jgi:histidinol-phosphate aminotransferase
MVARLDDNVAIVAIVTPNNPTGDVAGPEDLRRLSAAAPDTLVIVDHAYVEFADTDLTELALEMPNVVVLRTFSKVWGLAGCRVGYALGPSALLAALRAAGGPFPVSAPSLAIAARVLEHGAATSAAYVARVRIERAELYEQLQRLGARPRRSSANFVFAELGTDSARMRDALATKGVLVRLIADRAGAPLGLRISLPGDVESFAFLTQAVAATLGGAS